MTLARRLNHSQKHTMKKDNEEIKNSTEPLLACRVLITGTTVGDVILAAGAVIRLPKGDAETLAALTPPAVEITGI